MVREPPVVVITPKVAWSISLSLTRPRLISEAGIIDTQSGIVHVPLGPLIAQAQSSFTHGNL